MPKCPHPPREVDAVVGGIPGKKLYDACNGAYLGSVVDDPTPDTSAPKPVVKKKVCGENDCVLSYGTDQPAPLVPPDHRLPWPFGLLLFAILAIVLWHLVKTVRAKHRRSA